MRKLKRATPDEIEGYPQPQEDFAGLDEQWVWSCGGKNYHYPYITRLEEFFKPVGLKVQADF